MDAQRSADLMTETNITTQKLADWPRGRLLWRLRMVVQSAANSISQVFHCYWLASPRTGDSASTVYICVDSFFHQRYTVK